MIKLFTDTTLLTSTNRRVVHPLLFDLHYYEHTHPSVKEHYELVESPKHADAFILPLNYGLSIQQTAFTTLYDLAVKHDKKLHIYTGGDYGTTFNDPMIITWRNAGFKSTNTAHTLILPAFMDDPIASGRIVFKTHKWQPKPVISFTGFATNSFKEKLRIHLVTYKSNVKRLMKQDVSDFQKAYNAAGVRAHYLKQLEQVDEIETNFIYRNAYRAGAHNQTDREKTTQEFFENLNQSPYTFCLRGAGNFSVRFYESLASGRIPVLVDTDVHLPLAHHINWSNHICIVKPDKDIAQQLVRFHNSLNQERFIAFQESNRALYELCLVRHHYFCIVHDYLKENL